MDATDVAQDRNQLSAANLVVVDREAVLRDLLAALKELLSHSGWKNLTDDELRWEAEQGNGMAPILLRARAAIAQAEGHT